LHVAIEALLKSLFEGHDSKRDENRTSAFDYRRDSFRRSCSCGRLPESPRIPAAENNVMK
jgi:hypothetical protein